MNTLPIDRSRRFDERDYPSDPEQYVPLIHFGQRVREDWRFLDGDIIEQCFENGELRDNNDGCGCFRLPWGEGVAYYLIVGFHDAGYRIAISAWPHVHHRDSALESGKWATEEIDLIQQKNRTKRGEKRFEDKYPVYADWLAERFGD